MAWRDPKTSEKSPKNWFFGLIFWNFQHYIKNRNICDTLPCTELLVRFLYKLDLIWACNLPKTTQEPPKMLLFAGTRNFEIMWLDNHKWYTDETYQDCVSPWDLSFAKKLGCHPYWKKRAWCKNFWIPPTKWGFWANFFEFSTLYQKPYYVWCKILACITVPNLKRIWLHLGELWPKNHPKAHKAGTFCWSENIWILITWQPQIVYSWNLPHLCISMRPFIWHKIGASPTVGNWAWSKTPPKMAPNSQTFNFNLT